MTDKKAMEPTEKQACAEERRAVKGLYEKCAEGHARHRHRSHGWTDEVKGEALSGGNFQESRGLAAGP